MINKQIITQNMSLACTIDLSNIKFNEKSFLCTPWLVGRSGTKLGSFEQHLLTRVSRLFAFFTTDGKSAVNQLLNCINRLNCSKNVAFIHLTFFMQLYRLKYLKCLNTRKSILEHKCEWNSSLVWLFLAIVTFYLNCLNRVVLAHPFWALTTFLVCFSVLSCWTNRALSMGKKWSSWILKKTYQT
jgi:hypothetical protein